MAAAHLGLMKLVHATIEPTYALALYFSGEKILLITAVAMVFSSFDINPFGDCVAPFLLLGDGTSERPDPLLATRSSSAFIAAACRVLMISHRTSTCSTSSISRRKPESIGSGRPSVTASMIRRFVSSVTVRSVEKSFEHSNVKKQQPFTRVHPFNGLLRRRRSSPLPGIRFHRWPRHFTDVAVGRLWAASRLACADWRLIWLGLKLLHSITARVRRSAGEHEEENGGGQYPLFLNYCLRTIQIDPYFTYVHHDGAGVLGWKLQSPRRQRGPIPIDGLVPETLQTN